MGTRLPRPRTWLLATLFVGSTVACGNDPTADDPMCGEEPVVGLDSILPGVLGEEDDRLAGAFIDYYSFELDNDTTDVLIALRSEEIDPLLIVIAADPERTYQTFDSVGAPPGQVETASLLLTADPELTPDTMPLRAGCHLIGASSWYPDSTGTYTLTVEAYSSQEPE